MKFICLGYFDEWAWEAMPEAERQTAMEKCLAYDDELRRGGHFLGGEALQSATKAVTLRMKGGRVAASDGPFTETKEHIGGILILEATDMQHAVALMSKHPGVAFGPFEIRPVDTEIHELVASRSRASEAGRG